MIKSTTGRILLAVGLGLTLTTYFPTKSEAQMNPECKDKTNEVRLKNESSRTIKGAVDKGGAFQGGSDSYYDIKPGETRCWSRRPALGQLKIWFKDGSNEQIGKATAGDTKTFTKAGTIRDGG